MTCLLNNEIEINIMLYYIMLKLELTVWSNIIVVIKEVGDLKLSFIGYIPDVSVKIEDVMVKQLFFILEKSLNLCILNWFFKTITHMARQTLNDGSVRVTIFNPENDMV